MSMQRHHPDPGLQNVLNNSKYDKKQQTQNINELLQPYYFTDKEQSIDDALQSADFLESQLNFQVNNDLILNQQDFQNFVKDQTEYKSEVLANRQISVIKRYLIDDKQINRYRFQNKYTSNMAQNLLNYKKSILQTHRQSQQVDQAKVEIDKQSQRIFKRKPINRMFLQEAKRYFDKYHISKSQGKSDKIASIRRFAQKTGYGYSTIYKLYKKWSHDPTLMNNASFDENYPRCKSIVSVYRESLMFKIIQHNPLLSSAQVAEIMANDQNCHRKQANGNISKVQHRSIIRSFNANQIKKIRIRLISSKRNYPEDLQRRKIYCQELLYYLQKKEKIYYLDEMTVNKWVTRDKAWSRQGQCFANVMVNLKNQSFLIIGLMGSSGVVKYEVILGNSPANKYCSIIEKILTRQLQKSPNGSNVIVIHAAVGNDSKQRMKIVAEQKGFKILILPPFSPSLNPLQYWFSLIKASLKKQKFTNDKQLIEATKKVINIDLKNKPNINYFSIAHKFLQKGLNRQHF